MQGYAPPPPFPEITCGFLVQLVFGRKKLEFVGVEVKHEIACVQTLPLSPTPTGQSLPAKAIIGRDLGRTSPSPSRASH